MGGNGQQHRKNTSGLRPPWKKGESGNPGGRPKGSKDFVSDFEKACEARKIDPAKFLMDCGFRHAAKSGGAILQALWDRYYGKLADKLDVEHGGAIKVYQTDAVDAV